MKKYIHLVVLLLVSSQVFAKSEIDQCTDINPLAKCEMLAADLFNSPESKAPDENFLKNRYVTQWNSKNAPLVFIPKGNSILPVYLGSNCLGENQKKCLNEAIEEHTQIHKRESFAESLTQVGKFEKEWGIRPDQTSKVTKYSYHIRQNGNYVIGLSKDGSRKFYFLINLQSGKF